MRRLASVTTRGELIDSLLGRALMGSARVERRPFPSPSAWRPGLRAPDLTALGRQEEGLAHSMARVKLHDEYGA